MRAWVAFSVALTASACGFSVPTGDVVADAPNDSPPDVTDAALARTRQGLVGFWTFDDAPGTRFIADTAQAGPPVPLEVMTSATLAAPTFSNGNLVALQQGRLHSAENTHLPADCAMAGAVTLEVWAMPNVAMQGALDAPSFVAGLASNVVSRDVALMQAGDKWVGQVRTTSSLDGKPNLISTSVASTSTMTHLVLIADATQRVLYVNDVPQAIGAPGGPMGWDVSYPMALIDEYQHARLWTGTLALVALYRRGLSAAEVHQNFIAGPDAP
ncbi:MAG: hypothetical protein JWP01_3260 [Myxococcales bacterium]|nr:hypothetical protein [Myxococcales bacterium]